MFCEVSFEGEGLSTLFTLELLSTATHNDRVRLHVGSQVGPVCKGSPAVGTPIGFLARVRPPMALQQPGSREGLSTNVALMLQVVSQNVHRKRRHGNIKFSTVRTFLGQLAVETPMRLLVPTQIRRGRIVLPTFSASKTSWQTIHLFG